MSDRITVFIGYPIWWGGAALSVNHFVTDNDFIGKKSFYSPLLRHHR
ncbi:flavodoxin [Bifidobacterium pseudocatenulatum]